MKVIPANTQVVLLLMGVALFLSASSTRLYQFQQQSNLWGNSQSWRKPTRDPWTNNARDPWTKSVKTTENNPWKQPTMEPWTESVWPRTMKDPWTKSAVDPWTKPAFTEASVDPRVQPTMDPWTMANPNNNNNVNGVGSTADCQNALRQCSLFGVNAASIDNVYQQAFVTLLQQQRLSFQDNLIEARNVVINILNQFILNPDVNLSGSTTCLGADMPVVIQNDPTDVIPDPDSIPNVDVPQLTECVVSEWTEWSLPIAFGIVERKRSILQDGQCCPDDLVQRINITSYLNQNNDAFENPNNVAENFNNEFLNNKPRDILLIIDTSSSIYKDDFEVMKDGIKTMIDLFCGGFGNDEGNNRLAIMQFSTSHVIKHYFSDPQTPEALKAKVDQMEDFGGRTCTGDALIAAHNSIFQVSKGARPNLPNDTLVVTDGHANCGANLLKSANILQQRSESIYALGIGISDDVKARAQVTSLVTNEDPHHIFALAHYDHFKQMIEFIKKRQVGKTCTPIVAQTTGRK